MSSHRWIMVGLVLALFVGCSDDKDGFGAADGDVMLSPDASPVTSIDAAPPVDAAGPQSDGGTFEIACTFDEIQPILQCVTDNCLDAQSQPGGIAGCVALSCGLQLLSLPPDCAQCVLAGISGDPQTAIDQCVSGLPDFSWDGGLPTP